VTKGKPQTEPSWPTKLRGRFADGRCMGVDGSVWLYRSVPLAPVVDAASPDIGLQAAAPIMSAFEAMSGMAQVRMARRSASKSSYRQIHLLLVNIPIRFTPPPGELGAYLAGSFGDAEVDRRLLLFGVRLLDRVGGGPGPAELQGPGFRRAAGRTGHRLNRAVGSVAQTLSTGTTPLEDFDSDFRAVDEALARTGLRVPAAAEFRLANAWWNHGASPDTAFLEHIDHLHTFTAASSAMAAARLGADGEDCSNWPPMANTHSLAFGCVADFELPFVDASDPAAHWAADLLDAGAVCVSIRGMVEPPKVTRHELRRRKKQYIDDIRERADQGKMERAEQEEMLTELSEVEAVYSLEAAPPTLIDCSVLAAFSGRHELSGYDLSEVCRDSGVVLNSMVSRQRHALAETMLCSNVRAVPHLHDLPTHTIACSGLPSLSLVGDQDGALIGFTERDRQPAWLSPTAAASGDQLPIFLVAGATGSGKTVVMLWLADQVSRIPNRKGERTPVVILDPKAGSHHDAAVLAAGGRIASLDGLISADGAFDPLRFAVREDVGVELASSMLMSVNPWGSSREDWETPLIRALSYGASHGASCIGEALQTALDARVAPAQMVSRVFDLAESSAMFRACAGVNPGISPLRVADGISLIKVGESHLNLPEPGTSGISQQQRIALAIVRMMVFGSAMALSGRSGLLCADEAWVVLGAGRNEVERLGRLARSQGILPCLFTQRVTDATKAGLAGYISRGLILPIADPEEALAACELFKLEPTRERMERITAKASIGGTTADEVGTPNWWSMRALRDPATRKVLRGAVGIYADLSGRAVPVEVRIPDDFLAMASTNPGDIRARQEAERELATDPGAPEAPTSAMVEAVPPAERLEDDPLRTLIP
jgi:hypothetical protein